MRLGDGAFELTHRLDEMMADAHVAPCTVDEVAPLLQEILAEKIYHVEFGMFQEPGRFEIAECSRRGRMRYGECCSLVNDDTAIVAQLTCSPRRLAMHLDAYLPRATCEERELIQSGQHVDMLQDIQPKGILMSEGGISAALPWAGSGGRCCGLRIELKTTSRGNRCALEELVSHIQEDWPQTSLT
ncbi:hypothetical protein [Pseudoruegeria sp. HB172150]|uniref:hypothetical protein n=1 Tax=Pseudoruegeria sp. HB172150 TaxID=2721164 RepID=UPI001553C096|nr:hypothetical protein [Pseudoruegeria sp. HB172150]